MPNPTESTRRPAKGPRVGLAQIAPALGDADANLARHRAAVEKALADGCQVLVFPELSLAGYRLKDSVPEVAVARGSETWKQLEELSKDLTLVVGLVEESPDHLFYNSAACFEGGRTLAVHRKAYLPTYGMFDEQRYFARGNRIAAFDTAHGRMALLVCEDMLHPTAATIAACDGATILVVPSASPARGVTGDGDADGNARSWEAYLQVMARSFGIWIAYCNRVGVEDGVSFWGGSQIVTPAGEQLAKAAYYDEDFVSAVLSDDAVRRRRIANPLVRDEDLDLTINELSRIRGRAASVEKRERPGGTVGEARPRAFDGEKPPRHFDGERPPRRFDDSRPRRFDEDRPPRRFDEDRPPRRFDDDRPPRRFDEDRPPRRFDAGDRGEVGSPPKKAPRFPKPFGPRGTTAPPRRFGDELGERFDAPRGRFGPRDRGDAPRVARPRFGDEGPGRDRAPRPYRPRDDSDRKRPFGEGSPRFGRTDGPARPRFGGQERGGAFGAGPRRQDKDGFGPPRPRERQRPDPARKPFHKGKGPKPRGRG